MKWSFQARASTQDAFITHSLLLRRRASATRSFMKLMRWLTAADIMKFQSPVSSMLHGDANCEDHTLM